MRLALCCIALLMGMSAFGAPDYWVSVASAADLDEAERIQLEAGEKLSESFSLQPSDTSKGFYYRVVAGPFPSLESAQHMVAEAEAAGYTQAWVLPASADTLDTTLLDDQDTDLDIPDDSLEPSATEDLQALPNDVLHQDTLPSHKLVEEPPPGYQLNKLHRNDTADQ